MPGRPNGVPGTIVQHGGARIEMGNDRSSPERRRRPQDRQGQRHRVPLRAVRGYARQAEREAGPRPPPRRPADRRRRLRRLRRRRHRPGPRRSRHDRDARPHHADDPPVAPHGRPLCLQRHRGGRGVALLPAHDPAPRAGSGRRAGLRDARRRRARVLPAAPRRRRRPGARRSARHPRSALLRHAGADAQPRLRLRGLARRHRAGLGQLRHRPRGRQRPVRAELPVRRRADHVRPGDLLPLHGRVAGPAARAHRHVHAQAVRRT